MVSDEEVQYLELRVRQLEQMVTTLLSTPPPAAPAAAEPAPDDQTDFVYPNLESWITEEFAPIYTRPIGGEFRWCPRWWEHVEAVARFEALWRAWERLRLDPAFGMAVWYRDYLDISLPMITSARGPFARCSPERHEPLRALPVEAAPPNYWEWPEEQSVSPYVGVDYPPQSDYPAPVAPEKWEEAPGWSGESWQVPAAGASAADQWQEGSGESKGDAGSQSESPGSAAHTYPWNQS